MNNNQSLTIKGKLNHIELFQYISDDKQVMSKYDFDMDTYKSNVSVSQLDISKALKDFESKSFYGRRSALDGLDFVSGMATGYPDLVEIGY